jgi:hypothetical protein
MTPVFINPEDAGEVDVGNPLHVALLEVGGERWIPHTNGFFERVNNSMMTEMDSKIMDIVTKKANGDREFGLWVLKEMSEVEEKGLAHGDPTLGGGG